MTRVFWSTCPNCHNEFIVAWELRSAGIKLHCPFCENRYMPDDSESLDERA